MVQNAKKPAPKSTGKKAPDPVFATQQGRRLAVCTPFDDDFFLITRFSGMEAVSGAFQFKLDLVVESGRIEAGKASEKDQEIQNLVGQLASVSFALQDNDEKADQRYFHGMIRRILALPSDGRFLHYTMELVPWTWLLTQRTNSRVFQNKTVLEIVDKVFGALNDDFPFVGVKWSPKEGASSDALTGTYTRRDYCVQYRETDLNFISRLLEQEGISYYFDHNSDGHTLVLFDDSQKVPFCKGEEKDSTLSYVNSAVADVNTIRDWKKQSAIGPGKYSSNAYHMQLAGNPPKEISALARTSFFHNLENYEYTADYTVQFVNPERRLGEISPEGQRLADVRLEEQEMPQQLMSGQSWWRSFASGHKFTMDKHSTDNDTYVLLSVEHLILQDKDFVSSTDTGAHPGVAFLCVLNKVKVRPQRITPKPLICGPQTAKVVGKEGENIWLDEYGRARVQFHWERNSKEDENSTCWVRVVQSWAGDAWGTYFHPRIGDEVVVEFMEGDPDLPIITGSLFNSKNKPIYELPEHSTRSGIKTGSLKNGNSQNFNELRFEDKLGHEQIFLNAERDMDHRVENDYRQLVGNNQHIIVKASYAASVGSNSSCEVTGDSREKIGGKMSLQVTGARHETVGKVYLVQAGDQIHFASGTTIVIEGGQEVAIKGPGGFVSVGPSGVTIQGTAVTINSGGSAASGASPSPDAPDKPDVADDGTKGTKMA